MAPLVFKNWGIHRTDDIGTMVFALIAADRLTQSERDNPADFHDVFDLPAALKPDDDALAGVEYAPRRGEAR
jgi:uncharacterized repeat protein (TIGR04138 family)